MWLDVLDMPTVNHFEASFSEHFDEKTQKTNHQDGDSFERYATGVLPDGQASDVFSKRSPVINYPYRKMKPILERLKKTGDVDKRHGARVRYANPINGGPILPTMGARTRQQLSDALAGMNVSLSASEVAALEAAVPADQIAGTRYPAPAMATLDSEK